MGARLLLFVIILDCFLYFGMAAVGAPEAVNFGNQIGNFVQTNGTMGDDVNSYVNYSSGGTMVQASSLGFTTIGIDSIINFVALIYGVMTAPMLFAGFMGAPVFVQVLLGGTYIVLVLAAVAQLITGRFS